MTRRLGGNGRKKLTILATLSLAAALACGGTMGCGSSSSGNNNNVDSGPGDSGPTGDTGITPGDSGSDADSTTPDSGPGEGGNTDAPLTQLGVPTFTPASGTVDPGTVTITAPANGGAQFAANGGLILFTTNGTLPAAGGATTFVYSSPIAISATTTINAIATEPGFSNSIVATASYTVIPPEAGQLLPVAFAPPAAKLFPINATDPPSSLVALSSSSGATICYTLDGHTTPTCSAAGACTGTSQTYNAATEVVLNGTITDPTTGNVTVEAIACAAGSQSTTPISQVYTLSVVQPTIVSPAPGNLAYPGATEPGATLASATPFASINYTVDGTTPTCAASFPGLKIPTGGLGGVSGKVSITKNETINAIGCEPGYASSGVLTAVYTVTLNAPTFPAAGTNGAPGTYSAVVPTFNLVTDGASGEWVCETTAAAAPACGATLGACTTGTSVTLVGVNAAVQPITTTGTTVSAIACAVGLTPSAVAQGTYTLQLAPPDLNPPGSVGGVPVTSYRIPTPQVGVLDPTIEDTSIAATFACVIKGGTPACAVNSCTTGTFIAGPLSTTPALGTVVAAGDAWSVIACPANTNFLPSAVTTVSFTGPGQTTTPSITPTTNGPRTSQLPVEIANTDPTAGTTIICYTRDGSAPACTGTPLACTAGSTFSPVAQAAAATVSKVTVTAGGTGFVAAPNVTLTGGGGTGATATAIVTAGVVTAVAVNSPGAGYTSAPTVTFVGGGGTGAAATAFVTDVLVFNNPIAGTPNAPVQIDNTTIKAIACNSAETVSPIASETYNFVLAEPNIVSNGGDVNGGGTVGAGQTVTVTTPSNFDGETIHVTTNGTPATCATGTQIANGGTVTVLPASPFVLSAIACGQAVTPTTAAQQPSPVRTVTFTVTAATPTITAQVPGAPTGNLTFQNAFTTVISSVTAGAQICYRTDGVAPTCTAGTCDANSTPAANNVTVAVNSTTPVPVNIAAVACSATLAQSGVATANYTLQAANVVEVATGTAATGPTCPASVTLGLDNTSAASVAAGGATANVEICYGIGGAAAPVLSGACAPPVLVAGQFCFNSGGLGTTMSTIPTPTETETLHVSTCKAGFNPPLTVPATVAVTPYSNPITPNGSLVQFTPADTFLGTAGVTGYFSYDATNLYFAESGYTVATGSDVVTYLGVGAATDSTTGPPALGALALPFPAHWAIAWASDDGTAPTVFAWSGTAWATTTAIPVTVGFESGASVVFAVPIAALGGPAVVDVKGAFVTGVGTAPVTQAVWPATSHVAETLAACTQPSSATDTP
jgi:Chitobiase/beta-hexosaminidase C-terminal domain